MNEDLKIIKKLYGEKMAHFCRENFATLLETEGLLLKLMLNNFEPSHVLYDDILKQELDGEFKNYIYSLVDVENNNEIKTLKTPKELLSEAGYDLYECHTEEEIQRFKKYYAPEEELCTFNGGRLNRCFVFFAIKKDLDTIRREDYKNPERQDSYGTSVISIQFTRDSSHTLSIKNRYNHRVNNPDSTYSNNLDNIISGLTESFANTYGLIQINKDEQFEIDGYVKASDGKYYKYNYEINNIYYCPNNIIIDNFEVKKYAKEKYLILDYYVLDLVNKKLSLYDRGIFDAFIDDVKDITKIAIVKKNQDKEIILTLKNQNAIKIVVNANNEIIKLENNNLKSIGDYFMYYNNTLQEINLPNLEEIGNYFLQMNNSIKEINFPNLQRIGNSFLHCNLVLEKLNLPNLEETGNYFLSSNKSLYPSLSLPNLQKVGNYFLARNNTLQELDLPNLKESGSSFLLFNRSILKFNIPNIEHAGYDFLASHSRMDINDLEKGEGR